MLAKAHRGDERSSLLPSVGRARPLFTLLSFLAVSRISGKLCWKAAGGSGRVGVGEYIRGR